MSSDRLQTAFDAGMIPLPEGGRIALLRPPAGMALPLPPAARGRVSVVHTFRPDVDAWKAAGHAVVAAAPPSDLAIVSVPRSKALARALIAAACAAAPVVAVDGQRDHGIDSLWREVRARIGGDLPSVTQGHGRLFWFPASAAFADWAMPAPVAGADGFLTLPGVFAEGGVDAGSAALAAALPAALPARMADLGAGWGYLSRAVLARAGVERLDLIEAESLSLDCARLNVTDPRAHFHWADALTFRPERPFGGIVMNPPFHRGRAADPGLGRAFIAAAARMLSREGELWMVSNRHLPYEAALAESFRVVAAVGPATGPFKVHHASRPRR
ncbi:MAG: methyltransferase [Rubellimicrobium sp.]|nr:methyltransferase [Rubellimicrobium sp.]